MIAIASRQVADHLRRHGPDLEHRVMDAIGGGNRAATGVFVAVLSGEVERRTLLDGVHELRLTESAS